MVRFMVVLVLVVGCSAGGGGGRARDAGGSDAVTSGGGLVCNAGGECTDSATSLVWVVDYDVGKLSLPDIAAHCRGLATEHYDDYRVPTVLEVTALERVDGLPGCMPKCLDDLPSCECEVEGAADVMSAWLTGMNLDTVWCYGNDETWFLAYPYGTYRARPEELAGATNQPVCVRP